MSSPPRLPPDAPEHPLLNQIPVKQNSADMIALLRAKCGAYDSAQRFYRWQFFATALASLALAVLRLIFPASAAYVAAGGVIIAAVDWFLLDPIQKKRRTLGASFQELFDCALFDIPWREKRNGAKPSPEEIDKWAQRHPSSVGLRNWYEPAAGRLPLPYARVACQRANGTWNATMRDRFARVLLTAATVVMISIVIAGIVFNATILGALSWIAISLPLLGWLFREAKRQRDASATSAKVTSRADDIWRRLLDGDTKELVQDVRELQNDIYDQRKGDQQVFAWVYHHFRADDERSMRVGIEALVIEYEHALAARP